MSKYVVTPSLDVVCVATDIALAELWRTEAQPRQQESQLLFNSQCWQQQGLRHECVLLHPPDAKHPGTAPRGLLPGVADWLKKKQTPSCSQNDPAWEPTLLPLLAFWPQDTWCLPGLPPEILRHSPGTSSRGHGKMFVV